MSRQFAVSLTSPQQVGNFLRMGIIWEGVEVAAQTDQNGVEVWPNASTWMRVESRSKGQS